MAKLMNDDELLKLEDEIEELSSKKNYKRNLVDIAKEIVSESEDIVYEDYSIEGYDKQDQANIKLLEEKIGDYVARDYKTIIEETKKITDVYFVSYDFENSFIYQKGTSTNKIHLHQIKNKAFLKFILEHYKKIIKEFRKRKNIYDNIKITHEGLIFRVNKIIADSGYVYACRNIEQSFIPIDESGLSQRQLKEILHRRMNKGGLILVCGSLGSGKSTTAAGLIVKRLERYGGLCISIEDPIEFPIQGAHGNGFCIQVPVKDNFATEIKHSMRSYPTAENNILFIGEIRDAESAIEAIKSSIDGRLVIATMHTNSIQNTFARLASMVTEQMPEATSLLAESFRVVIHQKLIKIGPNISLQSELLVNTRQAYSYVKEKSFQHIAGEVESQRRRLNTEDQMLEYNNI